MQKATDALRANELLQRGEGGGPGDMKTEPKATFNMEGTVEKVEPVYETGEESQGDDKKRKKKKKQGAVPAAGGTGPRVKGHRSVRRVRC